MHELPVTISTNAAVATESNVQYTCVPKENCIQTIALKSSYFFKNILHMLNVHTDTPSVFYFYDLM